ncbi:hypothetical protein A1A1_13557 [Planococcus antarcticus DSM 14505]|uniref:DUF4097 domain-containing protein n=1 Tax=Planococcus antarcticus DSM 14505 TaxID=1185653 RepID=A0A1C7DK97_9BACL|nr:DUF4097 family beta strand repeat-containing protein [Planococcus antarcticus]ANU11936.1 hypothetical protein BBH88_17600 [Planococcus antarcticus DSM 14505]EIM05974.1 hypothetical protein A1A1_13557 [Planococcus antarcticus DSM 14505]
MKTLVRILIVAAVLLLIGAMAAFYTIYNSDSLQQDVLEEKTFNEPIDEMEITVENSRIEFLPSNDDTARIVVVGNDDNFALKTDVSGGRLVIEVEDTNWFFLFDFNQSYSLQVYVPANGLASLSADSDDGRIQANDIGATELSFQADNGRISLEAVESEMVDVETDNGRIELTNMAADMTLHSSNGRIIFTDVSGELQAKTNNGRIELNAETLDFPVDLETDNGRIEIYTQNEPENARIEAHVDNGSTDVFGRDSRDVSFGSGDVLIRLDSDNGSIFVE